MINQILQEITEKMIIDHQMTVMSETEVCPRRNMVDIIWKKTKDCQDSQDDIENSNNHYLPIYYRRKAGKKHRQIDSLDCMEKMSVFFGHF